jgi:hypothetical protein
VLAECRFVCRCAFLVIVQGEREAEEQQDAISVGLTSSRNLTSSRKWRYTMALAILAEIPDLTREQYEKVVTQVNQAGTPAGALFHAGGPVEGGYRVVEVWETREAADTFYTSALYHEAAAASPAQPKILMTWSVYGVDNGAGWHQTP